MSTPKDQQPQIINENECYYTSISFQGAEDSAWQQSNWGEYKQLSLWKSTPMLNSSSSTTSQESPSIPISETTTQSQENSTSLQWDFPAREQATQELEQDSNILLHLFGEKDLEYCSKLNPSSVLWNNLKEFSDEDFELFLGDSVWQDTVLKLKQSRRQSLERHTKDSDYLSFPTLTSNESSTSRPAGQTKCEKWFRDNGLIAPGYQLSAQAMALIMGFPMDWFDCLSPTEPQEESEQDISQDEQLPQDKQRLALPVRRAQSPSVESSISIPCLVKQPKQPEIKGVIKKVERDRFIVQILDSDSTVSVSKLFVYPDFSKLDKSSSKQSPPSKNCSRKIIPASKKPTDQCSSKNIPASKNNPRKNRRRKGEGSGSIHYRMVTKNGKQYQEAYYHYIENGKKRTKYIPKKLLDRVKEAESRKKPVADILVLLVGKDKNPRKSSDTLRDGDCLRQCAERNRSSDFGSEKVMDTSVKSPRKITPTSKRRRDKGKGSGWIQCKPITRNGKQYKQYWYNYEEWSSGDRTAKTSRYIPKRLLARVEKMNNEKVPVEEILKVLKNRSLR